MNWFPQIGAGSLAQYPLRRKRQWRNIENVLESGERITLPDPSARQIEWEMTWRDLNDTEADSLRDHFSAVSGSYGAFGFADPLANLLGWSEDLSKPDWEPEQIVCASGADDPFGLQRAWTLSNGAAGEQRLSQAVNLPAEYGACFSVWLRSDSRVGVFLERDGTRSAWTPDAAWKRAYVSATGSGNSAVFGLVLDAGVTVETYGFQVEAQPYPSQYKTTSTARGIYPETRFANDELTLIRTAPGLTACEIALVSRV